MANKEREREEPMLSRKDLGGVMRELRASVAAVLALGLEIWHSRIYEWIVEWVAFELDVQLDFIELSPLLHGVYSVGVHCRIGLEFVTIGRVEIGMICSIDNLETGDDALRTLDLQGMIRLKKHYK
ncbi:hypothetical protein H0H87_000386, partial [Tephrocybe sp. NHM501043]